MDIPFIDRNPNEKEVEKLRLILSTYQDGSGTHKIKRTNKTVPGWRDFERAIAAILNVETPEDKAIFDVIVPRSYGGVKYGISCKMRQELDRVSRRDGRVTIELSNSEKQFKSFLAEKNIR